MWVCLYRGSQTHLGVRATLQDISQLAGRTVFRDDNMVWRSAVRSPAGSGEEPQPKLNLMHFSLKVWYLVATISVIFLTINWSNLTFAPNFFLFYFPPEDFWDVFCAAAFCVAGGAFGRPWTDTAREGRTETDFLESTLVTASTSMQVRKIVESLGY